MLTLHYMMMMVEEQNRKNGWYDKPRPFEADIALLHSEVSEVFEAYRLHETDPFTGANGKPEGVPSELADVFIRLLDTCRRYNIDLEFEFEKKMAYNESRSYRHGGKRV